MLKSRRSDERDCSCARLRHVHLAFVEETTGMRARDWARLDSLELGGLEVSMEEDESHAWRYVTAE